MPVKSAENTIIRKPAQWSDVSERDLVRLAKEGSFEDAMVELWMRYKKRLYMYVKYRINFNRFLEESQEKYIIEDVIQNAFVDVLENLSEYDSHFEVSTWIYNITNKHVVRYIREAQKYAGRTPAFDDMPEGFQVRADDTDPSGFSELKEFERIVRLFVQTLKQKADRDVFLLYLQNLHTRNIADFMATTQDAVRARLNRVIKRMKKFLQRKYPEYMQSSILSQIKNLQIEEKNG